MNATPSTTQTAPDREIALSLRSVDRHYGGPPVVQDVTLDIGVGTTLAIIGPNGAGKTTLFSVMAGEQRANRGTVHLFGRDVTHAGARAMARSGVARTFQVARYFPSRTVAENVTVAALAAAGGHRRFWASTPRPDPRVRAAIEAVGLSALSDQRAEGLSQGGRKALEIAMALVQDPTLLLLDEPTAGMGVEDVPRTIETLQRLRRERPNLTCVVTAHDMDLVFAVADRVVLMASGAVALDGTPDDVRRHPRTREIYLGEAAGTEHGGAS